MFHVKCCKALIKLIKQLFAAFKDVLIVHLGMCSLTQSFSETDTFINKLTLSVMATSIKNSQAHVFVQLNKHTDSRDGHAFIKTLTAVMATH